MLTLAGESGVKFANAASNSGLPGDGIAQRSYSSSDSCSGIALPKPYRNCSAVSATAWFRLAGLRSAIEATLQRRRRQAQHALDRRRVDRHRRGGQLLPEQPLGDQAAERVADDDRLASSPRMIRA